MAHVCGTGGTGSLAQGGVWWCLTGLAHVSGTGGIGSLAHVCGIGGTGNLAQSGMWHCLHVSGTGGTSELGACVAPVEPAWRMCVALFNRLGACV
ncbi:MAG: hypothetical protein LBK00_02160 [Treponema sp.]|nr:hypothetical protein [Treponema sp.]